MAARAISREAKDVADPARTHAPERRRPVDASPNLQIPASGRSAVTGIARPDRDQMVCGAAVIHARKAAGSRVRTRRAEKANAGPAPARKGVARKVWTTGIGAADHPKAMLHAARGLPNLHARRTTIVAMARALPVVHAMVASKPGSSIVLNLSSNRKARRMTLASPSANTNVATSAHDLPKAADLRCGNTIHSRPTSTVAARRVTLATRNANINAVTSAHDLPKAADLRCGNTSSRLTSNMAARRVTRYAQREYQRGNFGPRPPQGGGPQMWQQHHQPPYFQHGGPEGDSLRATRISTR